MTTAQQIIRNGRVTSNAARNRQAAFRQRMLDEGLVQVTGWVHTTQQADATQLLRRLRNNEALTPGPLRNTDTNRFVSLNAQDDEDD